MQDEKCMQNFVVKPKRKRQLLNGKGMNVLSYTTKPTNKEAKTTYSYAK
jgi:hypothetical protein